MEAYPNISGGVAVGLLLGIFVCLLLPIGGVIWCRRKYGGAALPFVIGMAAFVVSQIFIRIPLIQNVLPRMEWYAQLPYSNYFLYGLFLSFTAGLFEETARFLCVRFVLKRNRRFGDAVAFGFGHGGAEAVLITGLTLINYLTYCIMINKGSFADAVAAVPAEQLSYLVGVLYSLTPSSGVIAAVERIIAVALHISMTIIVFRGFAAGRPGLHLLYAIMVHTVVDLAAVMLPAMGLTGWAMEGVFALMTAGALALALYMSKLTKWSELPEPVPAQGGAQAGEDAGTDGGEDK